VRAEGEVKLRTHLNTHAYLEHLYGYVRVAQVKKCRVSSSHASFCSTAHKVRTKLRDVYVQQARIHRFYYIRLFLA